MGTSVLRLLYFRCDASTCRKAGFISPVTTAQAGLIRLSSTPCQAPSPNKSSKPLRHNHLQTTPDCRKLFSKAHNTSGGIPPEVSTMQEPQLPTDPVERMKALKAIAAKVLAY